MRDLSMGAGRWLALAVLGLSIFSTAQAGEQDFVLHNSTGVEIYEVYVSPSRSNEWEEDILDEDTLPDGESVTIRFDDRENAAKWDIKVVDGDDNGIEWGGLDLTEISEVTLYYKKGKAWAEVE